MHNIIEAEIKLNNWLLKNGIAGYDPYDLYSQVPHFRKVIYSQNFLIIKTLSRFYSILDKLAPLMLRKVFRVKKTINAKGVGLLGLGYLYRYKRTKEEKDKQKVFELANWLINNQSKNYPGISWGYPFDWQSRIFIPEGTPSVVVSYTVGDFFLKLYQYFGEKKYLDIALGVCEFINKGLNKTVIDSKTICFSYTPLDHFQVHNANLFGAEFLVRVGTIISNSEYVNIGLKAANFAINEQLPDGSLNYWGDSQNDQSNNKNDHYHAGFEIRSLVSIGKLTGDIRILESAKRYYKYYLANFFAEEDKIRIPKMIPSSVFPLDIHACAEAIILNTVIFDLGLDKSKLKVSVESTNWIIDNMQNNDGSFSAARYKFPGFYWNNRIPYLRWGQAWMFYALNYLLFNLKNSDHI